MHSSERLSSVVSLVKCHKKGVFKSVGVLKFSHVVFLKVGCVSDRILNDVSVLDKSLLRLRNARAEL